MTQDEQTARNAPSTLDGDGHRNIVIIIIIRLSLIQHIAEQDLYYREFLFVILHTTEIISHPVCILRWAIVVLAA